MGRHRQNPCEAERRESTECARRGHSEPKGNDRAERGQKRGGKSLRSPERTEDKLQTDAESETNERKKKRLSRVSAHKKWCGKALKFSVST